MVAAFFYLFIYWFDCVFTILKKFSTIEYGGRKQGSSSGKNPQPSARSQIQPYRKPAWARLELAEAALVRDSSVIAMR